MKLILLKVKGMRTRESREKIENPLSAIDFDIAVLSETNIKLISVPLSYSKFTTIWSSTSELVSEVCVSLSETCKLINEPVINPTVA